MSSLLCALWNYTVGDSNCTELQQAVKSREKGARKVESKREKSARTKSRKGGAGQTGQEGRRRAGTGRESFK